MPIKPPLKSFKIKTARTKLGLSSKRVSMRALKAGDYSAWKVAHEQEADRVDLSREAFQEIIKHQKSSALEGRVYKFAIFHLQSGKLIGSTDLMIINHNLSWANLGYGVFSCWRRQGYASEAAALTLKIGFEQMGLHRIEASCEVGHTGSKKVALAAGLKREGTRRKFFPHPETPDMWVFASNRYDYEMPRF